MPDRSRKDNPYRGLTVIPPNGADYGRSFSDAELECEHGRLPGDRTAPCGCWPQEWGREVASGRGDYPEAA